VSVPSRILDRLRAGGWRVGLGIKIEGDAPPPPDLLAELQAAREAVLRALVEETLDARLLRQAEAILATWPEARLVAERPARALGDEVRRWLSEGASVEALGGGFALTLPDGRSLTITAAGCATLDDGLRGDLAERVAIRAEGTWRPPAWAEEGDAPRSGDRCRCCRGQRWWRPANPRGDGLGLGWRCATCHPPPPGRAVWEVRT
jgi:hypothetical protein